MIIFIKLWIEYKSIVGYKISTGEWERRAVYGAEHGGGLYAAFA